MCCCFCLPTTRPPLPFSFLAKSWFPKRQHSAQLTQPQRHRTPDQNVTEGEDASLSTLKELLHRIFCLPPHPSFRDATSAVFVFVGGEPSLHNLATWGEFYGNPLQRRMAGERCSSLASVRLLVPLITYALQAPYTLKRRMLMPKCALAFQSAPCA